MRFASGWRGLGLGAATLLLMVGAHALMNYQVADPDRPPGNRGVFDEADFVRMRDDYVAMLRGDDPARARDPAARSRAIVLMDQQMSAVREDVLRSQGTSQVLSIPTWAELGPAPIPNGQTEGRVDPVSGRVTTMVVDPTDSNILYVGTAQGGVWRSLDGGVTFAPIFDGAQSLAIGALTIDPVDHTRLWVGTGEPNASADSFAGVGLYRVDSANTSPVLNGPINPARSYNDTGNNPQVVPVFNGRSISKILVDPLDPNVVFVTTAGGVIGIGGDTPFGGTPPRGLLGLYRLSAATGPFAAIGAEKIAVSTAGSLDLPNTGNRAATDMVFDPADPTFNTLLVWINGNAAAGDGGAYRSTNALGSPATSVTFTQTVVTATSGVRGAFSIYLPVTGPAVVYAATGESTNGRVRRSIDGGVTWPTTLTAAGGYCGGQCFYNVAMAVVPGAATTTDRIHIGGNVTGSGTRLHARSIDGGTTFVNLATGLHADTHFIYVDPTTPTTVYHGNDGGLWKSIDAGTTWTSLNANGIKATQFSGITVHPTDPNFTIGGTQDNGTNNLLGDGATWNRIDFGDGGYALIDRNATDTSTMTVYHTYFNQTNNLLGFGRILSSACAFDVSGGGVLGWSFKGIYGGSVDPTAHCDSSDTFNGILLTDAVLFYAPMELGPGNPNTVYYGAGALYRSVDRGQTMPAVSQRTSSPISTIAVSGQDDNYRMFGRRDGSLFYTTTGANPMTDLDVGNAIPNSYIGRIVFDPADKNKAYIGVGGYQGGTAPGQSHLWRAASLDTTPVLTAINGSGLTGLPDVPVNALAVDANDPTFPGRSVLYVGTDIGVYRSIDDGLTWAPFGVGLPRVAVFGMAIQNVKRVLRIATHGRGMWEIGLEDLIFRNGFDP